VSRVRVCVCVCVCLRALLIQPRRRCILGFAANKSRFRCSIVSGRNSAGRTGKPSVRIARPTTTLSSAKASNAMDANSPWKPVAGANVGASETTFLHGVGRGDDRACSQLALLASFSFSHECTRMMYLARIKFRFVPSIHGSIDRSVD
jgi:hypothetical protein